jgi:DNA mismatch endonuclease (patch repair protein)
MELRRALHRSGLRYRVDLAPIPGLRSRADIVFPRARVAVFVDGCFWHCCPLHGTVPKANQAWWFAKLATNRERDAAVTLRLAHAGWKSIRIWEHQDPESVARDVARLVRSRLPE